MMHSTKTRGFIFGTVLCALASLMCARPAHASRDFPVALRNALEKRFPGSSFCVPLCTACHNTTTGGPGNYNIFGANLLANGLLKDDPGLVEGALNAQLNKMLDVDGDKVSDADELAANQSPSIAGAEPFCPADSTTYGCFARIAPAPPPVDRIGLLSAGLVVVGLTVLRRQRRLRKAQ